MIFREIGSSKIVLQVEIKALQVRAFLLRKKGGPAGLGTYSVVSHMLGDPSE